MTSILEPAISSTSVYISLVGISSLTYATYLHLTGFVPTLPRILTVASFHGILWPATSIILTVLGMWFRFLPPSEAAFLISGLISLIPSFTLATRAADDVTSSPLARKADRTPPPGPVEAPPPPPPPQPKRVDSWKNSGGRRGR